MDNPHTHSNHGFPFCINGVYSGPLIESQQQPQYQQHQQQQEQAYVVLNPNPHCHASNLLNCPTVATLFEKQKQEIEQFVQIQNDKLKLVLQQQREKQIVVLKSLENYSQQFLITKNGEIARAALKNKILENRLNSLEAEKRDLEKLVKEREAVIIALHNQLEEEKKRVRMFVENDEANIMCCFMCNTKSLGVLFLPCRHLFSCNICEALVEVCPICGMEKNGAIEIQSLISS
ncbi:BOI-related E3 ubiquitin-protein ligase 1-like [Trifolium pratense]|uniref:BOI-related E3 ubiquitin-protein ligase 1-like n=1 Tax=Trifolium pratense TaxID=57577 RepID=UPI001E6901B9|nr:BOI-related E3 ubiquitin-protein ligase 1-like [Trifolium pratense]